MLLPALFLAILCIFCMTCYFTFESIREHERHAVKVGVFGVLFSIFLAGLVFGVPFIRVPFAVLFTLAALCGLFFLVSGKSDQKALQGCQGHIAGDMIRHDQRDTVFARQRSIPPGSKFYAKYYAMHPEKEAADTRRREKGMMGKTPGAIDSEYAPNMSIVWSSFDLPHSLGLVAKSDPEPNKPKVELSPERATEIVKGLAKHLGAVLTGVCRIDPLWVYSHRGEIFFNNWDEWGQELKPENLPPFALVFAVEMDNASVGSAPHTPAVTESAVNYAKGAYVGTVLARWFSHMGYRGVAEHTRNYDTVLPAMAVDAGLGEVGRLGYLIGPRFGARLRLFAALTDMPLVPDKPISIGVDRFCQRCKKCAECCPSHSIPLGEKVVYNGSLKWKLNEETCYDYWTKVGTDCCVCMAICPFSRPNTFLHNTVRWLVARSGAAQRLFPLMDNFLYGKKWRPKPVPDWLAYPKGRKGKKEVYSLDRTA